MAEETSLDSLGPRGPNIISVEALNDTMFSVEGSNFVSGFQAVVEDGVGQKLEGVTVSDRTGTAFTLTLPHATPGLCTLVLTNPDGHTSSQRFSTPGTTASNEKLRAEL